MPGPFTLTSRDAAEKLDRFAPVFTRTAEIAPSQLGWRATVLPFRNVGPPAGYGIALGMADEISAALSRFRSPRMIAPVTFWDGTGPAEDSFVRCRLYRLDYVVDSSIEVEDQRVRVNVTLSDVILDFEVIWTGHFEGALGDLFSLQDRIARAIVVQLDPDLFQREQVRLCAPPAQTDVAVAHHSVLAAIHGIYRLERPRFMRARDLLEKATQLDPTYAAAYAWMAYWSIIALGMGWVSDAREMAAWAGASADKAVALDPTDARAYAIAGHVKAYLLHDVQEALRLHARAIELAPNLSIAWTTSSWSKIYNGEHLTAIRHANMAQSLSPRDPHSFFTEHALITAYFFRRQLEEAELLAYSVLAKGPRHTASLLIQIAILGHMGRSAEAAESLSALREINPNVSVSSIIGRPPLRAEDRDYYAAGLRLAGVPDDSQR